MTEKRWLYFALGVTTVISIGAVTNQLLPAAPASGLALSGQGVHFPDGTVQVTAAPRDPRLGFYVTSDLNTFDGAEALGACTAGYHMAQVWEILDPSSLRYSSEVPGAFAGEDGPIPAWVGGWVRTGAAPNASPNLGPNCHSYSTNADLLHGTLVYLERNWSIEASAAAGHNGWLGPWFAQEWTCENSLRVWCVEDYPGAGV